MAQRQEWEYLFVDIMPDGHTVQEVWSSGGEHQSFARIQEKPKIVEYFDKIGAAGWELTVYRANLRQFIFKRPK
ncbi:MAG: hypothetical protein JW910_10505 [Anaerolineae bacterium]|nr:hypothetical protein [Anaerolineae bacterium]